jgi:4-hydroxybenzoate polyprenyltransferase
MCTTTLTHGSRGCFGAYFITMRPYLLFVSGAAGLVGEALVTHRSRIEQLIVFIPLFFAYGLGQALTDTFQTDTDSVSAPYRPLVRGEISVEAVRWTSLIGLVTSSLLLCTFSPWVLVPATLAVLGLLAYTPCKRRYWAGPACNSMVVALLPVIGSIALTRSPALALRDSRLLPLALSVFGSYAVFVIIGYLKDVEADRQTGYDTLPVRFGNRVAVLVSAAHALLGAIGSIALLFPQLSMKPFNTAMGPGLVLWGFGFTGLIISHGLAWSVTRDGQAHRAIGWSVRAFLALHLGEAILIDRTLTPFVLALLLAFEVTLALRPARSQI